MKWLSPILCLIALSATAWLFVENGKLKSTNTDYADRINALEYLSSRVIELEDRLGAPGRDYADFETRMLLAETETILRKQELDSSVNAIATKFGKNDADTYGLAERIAALEEDLKITRPRITSTVDRIDTIERMVDRLRDLIKNR